MKKIIAVILVLCMAASLSACGKSQSVKDVEKAISAIGKVTLNSGESIEKAERMYEYLTESEKSQVGNKGDLVEARFAYDQIYADKIYATAKEAYELLKEAARLYYFTADNMYNVAKFGSNTNMMVDDNAFCKKFADATEAYLSYPGYTEAEIREALAITKEKYQKKGWAWNDRVDLTLCINIQFNAFGVVRDYNPNKNVEEAGVLLLELRDTYHDEKYYPVLSDYRDFVATGESVTLNSSNFTNLHDGKVAFQTEFSLAELKIEPMFMN